MTVEARSWSGKQAAEQPGEGERRFGPLGYLFLLLWTVALVLVVPPERTLLAAALALLAGIACHSGRVTQKAGKGTTGRGWRRSRWLLFAGMMALPYLVAAVEVGPGAQPPAVSRAVLADGLRMVVRAAVIMVAANQFAGAVSIGEIAALFERAGAQGLGFALGVAVNLLPLLRQTIGSTWASMRMRGGFRRRRLHHLRLFLSTLLFSTLRRAEMIALAAETRAYSPEKSQPVPLPRGTLDLSLLVAASALFLILLFV